MVSVLPCRGGACTTACTGSRSARSSRSSSGPRWSGSRWPLTYRGIHSRSGRWLGGCSRRRRASRSAAFVGSSRSEDPLEELRREGLLEVVEEGIKLLLDAHLDARAPLPW